MKAELKQVFVDRDVGAVVASAACGADIVALEVAFDLGIRTCIVLPFERARFRATSVTDRGEHWGQRYDAIVAAADLRGDVTVVPEAGGDDDAAYGLATARIISDCLALAKELGAPALAVAVWDERPREGGDATKDFIDRAVAAGIEVVSIPTVC